LNILLINHYAGSIHHGMEYRPYYLAREWTLSGHSVTIAASSISHVRTRQPVLSSGYSHQDIDGIHYSWFKTTPYTNNGIRRAINIFSFVIQLYRYQSELIKAHHPDIVIASSTYPLDIYPAHQIATKYHARLIFEVHDLWPLSPIELGGLSPKHPYIMLLQRAEDFAYQHADRVISMLPKAESHMRRHGLENGKFIYIPNGINVQEWQLDDTSLPAEISHKLARIHDEGKFIIGYAGAHGLANALDPLIEAGAQLFDEPVTFVLVGQGPEKERLKQLVRKKSLNNVVFFPTVVKAKIPALLKSMDALYVGLKSEPLFRFGVSPNKLLDYMMAAKPVIYAIKAGNDIVSESQCGLSIPPDDPHAIADAIRSLMRMSSLEREIMGEKGKEYVLNGHDYRILAKKFLNQV
jgi:glycosyltransferase involved in cell wall biosynthesis